MCEVGNLVTVKRILIIGAITGAIIGTVRKIDSI